MGGRSLALAVVPITGGWNALGFRADPLARAADALAFDGPPSMGPRLALTWGAPVSALRRRILF